MKFDLVSLFSGAGGLDLGFHNAGFHLKWANEFDETITPTLRLNFPETEVDDRNLGIIPSAQIPNAIGIIGGPPCQSWSEAGAGRGLGDRRGQIFLEYIRVIRDKKPLFFLAENVSGMLSVRHKDSLDFIIEEFEKLGYHFTYKLLNAYDYGVPEDRKRVFFIGYDKKLGKKFSFPESIVDENKKNLKDSIWDLRKTAEPAKDKNKTHGNKLETPNHEYMNGGFSTIYMSRNRVRSWDEPSFTIQAGGRHAPIHPDAPKMMKVGENKQIFVKGKESLYRRLSVRECARIQTFPDDFQFVYTNISDGYKMIGNAVPVKFAEAIANQIMTDVDGYFKQGGSFKPTERYYPLPKQELLLVRA
ncbi:DNA (cytosine-5-)-methyltransferase [Candidatus Saccharibacteria bacterium RIFCSPHIGHO2_12_FULL_41_12]|nr:MAG: DNA (cytosine-5-)-methyltransferase [Candidatus Saccharibacteria bacterium RIFCSPHIGHO2_12_FULL_41_12]